VLVGGNPLLVVARSASLRGAPMGYFPLLAVADGVLHGVGAAAATSV